MEVNETSYLHELRRGNEAALAFVITRYGGLVKSIVKKHLYQMEDKQEECFDDVFLNVWHHIKSYDERQTEFKNWIAGIARYKAIDYLRKYKHELEEVAWEEADCSQQNRQIVSQLEFELSKETRKLLECLTDEDRRLFWRLYAEEEQMEDVVKETGLNRNVIYKRISRGRKKIKKLWMERMGFDENRTL